MRESHAAVTGSCRGLKAQQLRIHYDCVSVRGRLPRVIFSCATRTRIERKELSKAIDIKMSQLIEAIKSERWDAARGLINGGANVNAVDRVSA